MSGIDDRFKTIEDQLSKIEIKVNEIYCYIGTQIITEQRILEYKIEKDEEKAKKGKK